LCKTKHTHFHTKVYQDYKKHNELKKSQFLRVDATNIKQLKNWLGLAKDVRIIEKEIDAGIYKTELWTLV